jgi:hypothetical protein
MKKKKSKDFIDYDKEQMDEFLATIKGDPNELRGYSDGGWGFSQNSPPGISPLNMTLKLCELGYDNEIIKDSVRRAYIGIFNGQIEDFIRYFKGRRRLGETANFKQIYKISKGLQK